MNSPNGTILSPHFRHHHQISPSNASGPLHHQHQGAPLHHRQHLNLDHLDLFYSNAPGILGGEEASSAGQLDGLFGGGEGEEGDLLDCHYEGTDYLEVKILLIGVIASGIALVSFLLNAFLVLVFAQNPKLRRSPLFYFGVLAMLDLALALLYLALMAVPVYMDQFRWLWLYHLFLRYLRPMLTLSNICMFASVLMILLATIERLLLTFSGKKINKARRLLERHRPQVTLLVVGIAAGYKLCTYFEIEVFESANCTGFEQFEVVSAVHENASNPMFILFGWDNYKFWWMFVTRNLVDHIFPFFLLVILNFHIIRALRRERLRATQHLADVLCSAAPPLVSEGPPKNGGGKGNEGMGESARNSERSNRRGSRRGSVRSLRESLKNKVRLRNRLQKVSAGTAEDQAQKKNLRAATRALVSVVSMYLMSKVLQVAVTFFETFASEELIMEANFGEFRPLYSYVNDAISILTLMSSALRFPVYCACNKPMLIASKATLERLLHSRNAAAETLAKRRRLGKKAATMMGGEKGGNVGGNFGGRNCCSLGRNGPPIGPLHRNDLLALANGKGGGGEGQNGSMIGGNDGSSKGRLLLLSQNNEEEKEQDEREGKRRVLRLIQKMNSKGCPLEGGSENGRVNGRPTAKKMIASPEGSEEGTEMANGGADGDEDDLELFC